MAILSKFEVRPRPMNAGTPLSHSLCRFVAGTTVGAMARLIVSGMAGIAPDQNQLTRGGNRQPAWTDGRRSMLLASTSRHRQVLGRATSTFCEEHSVPMPFSRRRLQPPRLSQRGAALLTAMIVVTLISTLAVAMLWQQWRAVQVEAAERERAQANWILSGALDFARLILREDLRSGRPTAWTEPWATPLAESRLSAFLAVDAANISDGPEAFLSGSIADLQSRYNLANLVVGGKVDPAELEALESLCASVGVDTSIATRLASGLRDARALLRGASPNSAVPLLPNDFSQLSWLGIDKASLQPLERYVAVLPTSTSINVNTASREVLMAVIKGLDGASADKAIQMRQHGPFKDLLAFNSLVAALGPVGAKLDVRSSHFEVLGRLRRERRTLIQRSIVQRLPNGLVNVLFQDRIAGVEPIR